MTTGAPIYPMQVATVSAYFGSTTWEYTETTPGSGYVDPIGKSPDQAAGTVTLADTTFSSWTAAENVWSPVPTHVPSDQGFTWARFPARADAATWVSMNVEVGYQGIAPTATGSSKGRDGVRWADWNDRLAGTRWFLPNTPLPSQGQLPDSESWSIYSTDCQFSPDLWNAGNFSILISQVTGFTSVLSSPDYPFRVAFVRIIPDLSVVPPLRQRQRSDGLAASGAPRQHQRATRQTSIRQRAIR